MHQPNNANPDILAPLTRSLESKEDSNSLSLPLDMLENPNWRSLDSLVNFDGERLPDMLLFRSIPGDDQDIMRSGPTDVLQQDYEQMPHHAKTFEEYTVMGAIQNLSMQQSASEPPAPKGGYIEPNYNANLSPLRSPSETYQELMRNLSQQQVDFCEFPAKYKLNCAAYFEGAKICFKVRIYTVSHGGKRYVVEFQRRSGNTLRFGEIFRDAMIYLYSKDLLAEGFEVPPDNLPSLSSVPRPPMHTDKALGTVKILLQMATSTYQDVRCEALRSLSEISSEEPLRVVLSKEGVVDVFLDYCSEECEDAFRCAISGLANLTMDDDCRSVVVATPKSKEIVQHLVKLLDKKGVNGEYAGFTPQIIREIARFLVNLKGHLPTLLDDLELAKSAWEKLRFSKDAVARGHATALAVFFPGTVSAVPQH